MELTPKELQVLQILHWINNPSIKIMLILLAVWVVAWKGVAFWKAARNNHTIWYVVLLLSNTLGILEIVYIFFFSKKEDPNQ